MSFKDYAEKVLYEEKVSSKLMKNAIDILNDYVYYVKADLSSDERKQVVDNLEVAVESVEGNSVKLNGSAEFVKDGKYNKKANFSVELKFEGISDEGSEGGDITNVDRDGNEIKEEVEFDIDNEEIEESKSGMKYYAQFYKASGPNSKTEMLGSESVFILDGRNRLSTMIADARERLEKLKNVHKNIIAFTINRGERFDKSKIIYDSNPELKIT